jgi:hypothetical protein
VPGLAISAPVVMMCAKPFSFTTALRRRIAANGGSMTRPLRIARIIGAFAVGTMLTWADSSSVVARKAAEIEFDMVPSAAVASCLPDAAGHVRVRSEGAVERMIVEVSGLPGNTDFDFFVIQVPTAPFGLSWYQGDIETNRGGRGRQDFLGRFNIETFIVAPGTDAAPVVHETPIRDASSNPPTAPVHTYHLGLWFNSPVDAQAAGCPGNPTPFNGDHTAGIQVLNTSNFPKLAGPLRQLLP